MSKDIVHLDYADVNTHSVLNILISFNCLIDTDFGLLVLIAQKFFDTSVFNEEFFRENDAVVDMKHAVYNRKDVNPLTLCLKNKADADDYYKQFFDRYYNEIVERSMVTDLAKNLNRFSSNAGASFTILCKNQEEIDLISRINLFKKCSCITINEIIDPDVYNQFFFKSYRDYGVNELRASLMDKSIYIGMYDFNKIQNLDVESSKIQTELFILRNNISLIGLYSGEEINNAEQN